MTDLTQLLERLESLEGPDPTVDGMIARELLNGEYPSPYTASLDAAVALVERVLPAWSWSVETWRLAIRGYIKVEVEAVLSFDKRSYGGSNPAIPIALLTAMIKALIAEKQK